MCLLQEAEMRVNEMKEEIYRLHKCLDERNGQFQEAASTAEKVCYLNLFANIFFLFYNS